MKWSFKGLEQWKFFICKPGAIYWVLFSQFIKWGTENHFFNQKPLALVEITPLRFVHPVAAPNEFDGTYPKKFPDMMSRDMSVEQNQLDEKL